MGEGKDFYTFVRAGAANQGADAAQVCDSSNRGITSAFNLGGQKEQLLFTFGNLVACTFLFTKLIISK